MFRGGSRWRLAITKPTAEGKRGTLEFTRVIRSQEDAFDFIRRDIQDEVMKLAEAALLELTEATRDHEKSD